MCVVGDRRKKKRSYSRVLGHVKWYQINNLLVVFCVGPYKLGGGEKISTLWQGRRGVGRIHVGGQPVFVGATYPQNREGGGHQMQTAKKEVRPSSVGDWRDSPRDQEGAEGNEKNTRWETAKRWKVGEGETAGFFPKVSVKTPRDESRICTEGKNQKKTDENGNSETRKRTPPRKDAILVRSEPICRCGITCGGKAVMENHAKGYSMG